MISGSSKKVGIDGVAWQQRTKRWRLALGFSRWSVSVAKSGSVVGTSGQDRIVIRDERWRVDVSATDAMNDDQSPMENLFGHESGMRTRIELALYALNAVVTISRCRISLGSTDVFFQTTRLWRMFEIASQWSGI